MKSRSAILEQAKARRRRRRVLVEVAIGAALATVLIFLWWVSHTHKLMISNWQIEGSTVVSREEINSVIKQELSGNFWLLFPKRHTLWYPHQVIVESLSKQFPRINSIGIYRQGFSGLTVKVTDREPAALVCGTKCFFTDKTGFIFALAPDFSSPVYLTWDFGSSTVGVGKFAATSSNFILVSNLATYLNEAFNHRGLGNFRASRVKTLTEGDYQITFRDNDKGTTLPILISSSNAPTTSARNFDLALSQIIGTSSTATLPRLEYFDLRFGNKVFYKL